MQVVLVGSAGHAINHLLAWRKVPGLTGLTVVGRSAEHLAFLAEHHEVEVTTDLDAALAHAERVDICTPTDTHFELAARCLAAGVPTLVEKPACRTLAQARQLQQQAGGTPLACALNNRYSPLWLRARQLVAHRAVGEPLLSRWPVLADNRRLLEGTDFRANAERGGGALLDGGIHLVDLIPWVLGRPLQAATAWLGQLAAAPPAGEDTALIVFDHPGGVAQLSYSWAVPNPSRSPAATIVGTDGTLLVPRSAKQPFELIINRQTEELNLGEFANTPRNDLANLINRFADDPGAAAAETWEPALTAQAAVEACERGAREGRKVTL